VPLIVAGGGGVAAIVGGIVLAGGMKKVSEAEEVCPSHECSKDVPPNQAADAIEKGNAGRQQQVIGGVVLGVGVAALGGGLLWYFLSSPSGEGPAKADAPRRPTAAPAFGPGYAGVSLSGSF
jgi:hypothetical protein